MDNFDLRKYLAEGKLLKENKIAQAIRDEAEQEDSKVGAAIFKKYAKKIESASKEDYRKILTSMERELIDTHPDTFDGDDDIVASFMALAENKLIKEAEEPTGFLFRFSKEDAMNKAMEVLDQKDIGYNELGVHLVFHDKFGPATEEEVSEILRGEDILDWVIGEWKGDIYLKSEEEIKKVNLEEMDEESWNDKNSPARGDQLRDPKKVGQATGPYSIRKEEINEAKMVRVDVDEIMMHINQYQRGNIDGDDLAQAVEEIVVGEVSAPGMDKGPRAPISIGDMIKTYGR